ncbi:f-box only protein 28 [Caerostris extrusa]|uniref:F-box only protein 28 n=1 Tax=Caerostris extrusa TaxID=172846 RepID=A0AAV4TUJ8_CAEEX|nr:f-box only protein 28 [Caerostris extrusa]
MVRKLNFNILPYEAVRHILGYLSFGEIARLRLVSKQFDKICKDMLNSEFYRLSNDVQTKYNAIKSQMPKTETSQINPELPEGNDIVETLHMGLALLNFLLGKHIERSHCCFFFCCNCCRIFQDHIEPTLPEIVDCSETLHNHVNSLFKNNICLISELNKSNQINAASSLQDFSASLKNTTEEDEEDRKDILTNDCEEISEPEYTISELLLELNRCSLLVDVFETSLYKDPTKFFSSYVSEETYELLMELDEYNEAVYIQEAAVEVCSENSQGIPSSNKRKENESIGGDLLKKRKFD